MGDVVEFGCARPRSAQRDAEDLAEQLIAALGPEAGYRIGCLARHVGHSPTIRQRLLRIAEEIERRQGFGWWFAGGEHRAASQEP
jgi:hypothetical protein